MNTALQLLLASRHVPRYAARSTVAVRMRHGYAPEPFQPIPNKTPRWTTAEEAVSIVTSGMRVYAHMCAGTPFTLLDALAKHGLESRLRNVEIVNMLGVGPAVYTEPQYRGIFRSNSLFIGSACRDPIAEGRADYCPVFVAESPLLFRRGLLPLDVALLTVSPPDEHGFCSLGTDVDVSRAAAQCARYILCEVNESMPRTFGDGIIHMSHCDAMVTVNTPIPEIDATRFRPNEQQLRIARLIADNLVDDGATLQTGFGTLPDAVLSNLTDRRDLGVHTEMITDGIVQLVEAGVVTNKLKNIQPGKIVAGFAYGSRRLYDFMHNNPQILMCDFRFVNDVSVICQNPRVTAINGCLEVDLTGQVCSESIGPRMYSGVGGQVDFIRGASLGYDGLGKPVLAMQSTTEKGRSKIVANLSPGAVVTTTRAHVHYLVTEYGIANLFGKNLRQRAYELIRIAHPDHRGSLEKAAFERLKVMPSP